MIPSERSRILRSCRRSLYIHGLVRVVYACESAPPSALHRSKSCLSLFGGGVAGSCVSVPLRVVTTEIGGSITLGWSVLIAVAASQAWPRTTQICATVLLLGFLASLLGATNEIDNSTRDRPIEWCPAVVAPGIDYPRVEARQHRPVTL